MANRTIPDYVTFLEKLRAENRKSMHEAAFTWNKWANDRSAELSKQLFTITSLILPLSLIPITNQDIVASLSIASKLCLILAWCLFIGSLITGILHLRNETHFFNKWAKQENERSHVYSEGIFTPYPAKAFKRFNEMSEEAAKLEKMPADSDIRYLHTQQILLVLGISMIGVVLIFKLFEVPNNYSAGQPLRKHMRERGNKRFFTPCFYRNY